MRRIWVCFILALTGAVAWADGGFAKVNGKPAESIGIPYQRAVLAFKDGTETLVVESTLRADPGEYVWLVPLPNPPSLIEKVPSGVLDALAEGTTPLVLGREAHGDLWMYVFAILSLASVSTAAYRYRRHLPGRARGYLFLELCIAALASHAVFLSEERTARKTAAAGSVAGVAVVESAKVGSYDVQVVRGNEAERIQVWLENEGAHLTARARQAISAYVKDGWCFMVAKLRKDEDDLRPHPLKVVFAAEEPVYPMRLTGATTENLVLDLFVCGQTAAKIEGLVPWAVRQQSLDAHSGRRGDGFRNVNIAHGIGHPSMLSTLRESETVTRLHGELTSDRMSEDYVVEWDPKIEPIRLYTPEKALDLRLHWSIWTAMPFLWLVGFIRIAPEDRFFRSGLFASGLSVLAFGATYWIVSARTPSVEARQSGFPPGVEASFRAKAVWDAVLYAEGSPDPKEFEDRMRAKLAEGEFPEPPEGGWIGEKPGHYVLERRGEDLVITVFDTCMTPRTVTVNAAGELSRDERGIIRTATIENSP